MQTIMRKAGEIIGAERSSLFLVDRDKGELWSKVAQGLETAEIRFPMSQGIAGHVASTGETLNIPDAYQHPLFNAEIDQKTGYRTRTILCMPMRNTAGQVVGVTQVINKRRGRFTEADEHLVGAISAQAAVAIDNAQLYERVRGMKAYLENVLQSLSNGVVTVDAGSRVTSANTAGSRLLGGREGATVEESGLVGQPAEEAVEEPAASCWSTSAACSPPGTPSSATTSSAVPRRARSSPSTPTSSRCATGAPTPREWWWCWRTSPARSG